MRKRPPRPGWRSAALSAVIALVLLTGAAWRADRNLVNARQQIELRDQAQAAEQALDVVLASLDDANSGQHGDLNRFRAAAALQQSAIARNARIAARRLPPAGGWIWVGLLICGAFMLPVWVIWQQFRLTRYFAETTVRLERFSRAFGMGLGLIREFNGRITVWSQGSERLYGYTAEEAVGRLSHELLQSQFPIAFSEIQRQLLQDGYWRGELLHRRRDGSQLRVMSHWKLDETLDRAEAHVIELNSDITSLAHTDALLRTISEIAPVLIYAKDGDGRMLLANPLTLELLGRSWTEIEGRTTLELMDDADGAAAIIENDRLLMSHGQGVSLEEQLGRDAAGAPRIWSSHKAPMIDGSGGVIGLVGVSVEITAKRRIEAQLSARTAELERAYADMADFAHIIAHDLRSPLRVVKLLSALISKNIVAEPGSETRSDLALLTAQADRMAMQLEGLLSFSQVGHGRSPSQPVAVAALLAEIIEMLAPPPGMVVRMAGEDLTIETPLPPLLHVLQNLIANAIKHHDRAHGEIVMAAQRTDGGVTFSVTDDGPGIPPASHDRIFNIFQTLAVNPEAPTSGVGLSIVRKTVAARGGKVWVESDPAIRGARFIFTWPEVAVQAPEPDIVMPAPVRELTA